MRFKELCIVVSLLLTIGLGSFFYRVLVLDFPLLPNKSVQSWHIEAKLSFRGQNKPVRAEMLLPRTSQRYTIVDENFVSDGFGMTTREDDITGNRVSSWTKRESNKREILFYRGVLYETRSVNPTTADAPEITEPLYSSAEFKALSEDDTTYFAMGSLIEELRQRSADDDSFMAALFSFMSQNAEDSRLLQLNGNSGKTPSKAEVAVKILRHAGINSRVMNGVSLDQGNSSNLNFIAWVQIYKNGNWVDLDPENGEPKDTTHLLPWWVGSESLYTLDGGRNISYAVSMKKHTESALTEAIWRGDAVREIIYNVSVFNLPVDIQLVFAVLFLVPIGALIVCVMRQIIGIQTFGTFMPVLVALAFRETQLIWGLVFFTVVTALGMVARSYLNRLQLLMVPRLSAIMVLVVLSIYIISVVTFNLNLQEGLSISLFPLVILTMLIERMSMTWEEFGAKTAIKSAFGSTIVAVIAYFAMNNDQLGHMMMMFPELLLVVLAFCILVGRYNGYKLTEYYRFRALTRVSHHSAD